MLGAVVAGAGAHLRRRQQPARLVGADVAHGHAGLARQLVDRQLACLRSPMRHSLRRTSCMSLRACDHDMVACVISRCSIDHATPSSLAAAAPPAGGAAIGQVAGMTLGVTLSTARPAVARARRTAPAASRSLGRLGRPARARIAGLPGWAALPAGRLAASRCYRRCSACTGTSRCTSTTAATPARSPTPRTTSSSSACSASSRPACSRSCSREERPGPAAVKIARGLVRARSAAC